MAFPASPFNYKAINYRRVKSESALRIALFSRNPTILGSGNERLVHNTAKALIGRGHDARIYLKNFHIDDLLPFYERKLFKLPGEYALERIFAKLTGMNDFLFPSTLLMRFHPWIGTADILHFHNLHGHYVSIPLLGILSWMKPVLISPVDQYLSTGHCPYTMECKKYLYGCGDCPGIDDPYPGISRDSTHLFWKIKKLFFQFSNVSLLYHTQALANHYKETFVWKRPSKVIPYGEDINCYRKKRRAECAQRLGVGWKKNFVIGLFHSFILDPRKGILPIIEKLGPIAKQFPDSVELLVVGHDSTAAKKIIPPGLSAKVLPFLRNPNELSDALNLCDVLLYPTQAENLSLLTISALACGVPVISFDAGGQKEAIKNGINGFIVDRNDYEGMFKALGEMIMSPELTKRLSDEARRTAKQYYDFDRYIDELIKYYYEIINNKN
jgi:glycosyltransferase involved in cell wall biosynthesis